MALAAARARIFVRKHSLAAIAEDIESAAMIGLIKGCRYYDPARLNPRTGAGYRLSTAVVPFIDGEMRHYVRDKGFGLHYPIQWREAYAKVRKLLDTGMVLEDVAEQVGMQAADVREMLAAMRPMGKGAELEQVAAPAPPPATEACPSLGALLVLAQEAARAIGSDAALLEAWWRDARRRPHPPAGPMQQFQRRAAKLARRRGAP